jgi:hypothetical protein
MAISAYETVKARRMEDWQDILDTWLDDPQQAASHMVLGMDLDLLRKLLPGATRQLPVGGPPKGICREKGGVKHDDRLDSLAQGAKYYALASVYGISSIKPCTLL